MASPDVLLLQETKIDKDTLLSLSKKSWNKNVGLAVSAHGSAGGIALVVREPFLSVKLSYNAALDFFRTTTSSKHDFFCFVQSLHSC